MSLKVQQHREGCLCWYEGREGGREREREGGREGWMDGWMDSATDLPFPNHPLSRRLKLKGAAEQVKEEAEEEGQGEEQQPRRSSRHWWRWGHWVTRSWVS